MIGLYVITNCPKCGFEIPIEYGYSCGFDATIEMVKDCICRNKNCMEHFCIDMNINEYKVADVDWNDFKPNDCGLVGIDSYNEYCEKLLKYIKNNE